MKPLSPSDNGATAAVTLPVIFVRWFREHTLQFVLRLDTGEEAEGSRLLLSSSLMADSGVI